MDLLTLFLVFFWGAGGMKGRGKGKGMENAEKREEVGRWMLLSIMEGKLCIRVISGDSSRR